MKIQKQLIKEAKGRNYSARSLAIKLNLGVRDVQKYFALKNSSSKITEKIFEHFEGEINFN
jgi:hypothetical protein